MTDNCTAFDVSYTRGLAGLPYIDIAPRQQAASGYARGANERSRRQQRGEAVPHAEHRPVYTLKHDERPEAKYRSSGDVAIAIRDTDGTETMTLDMEFEQAIALRDQINRIEAARLGRLPQPA